MQKNNNALNDTLMDPMFIEQAKHLAAGGEILPNIETLARRLQQAVERQKPLIVKLGLDPTRPDLHLGHTVVLRKLRAFQDLGHQAVLLIGDATALIGDPSGRNQTRPPLSPEEIAVNAQTYLDQAGKIIDVKKARIVHNSQWLGSMQLADFLKLAAKVTVAQLLVREDFAKRYAEQKPIHLHELFYPLMQGYDSVVVEADIELGGTDQRFNNLMGRDLQLAYSSEDSEPSAGFKQSPQMVLLMPLLEGTDGKIKMSKSYPEHCINITDPPEELFGKLMSIPDSLLQRYELLLTNATEAQLTEQARLMTLPVEQGGINPRDVKIHLARWVVGQFYGPESADQAEQAFISRFQRKELPTDMPTVNLTGSEPTHVPTLLAEHGLTASKAEARRLIQEGGVRLNGEKLSDPEISLTPEACANLADCVLQVGKRRFIRLIWS